MGGVGEVTYPVRVNSGNSSVSIEDTIVARMVYRRVLSIQGISYRDR